jgi:hypothetical protein
MKKYYENRGNPTHLSKLSEIFVERILGWMEEAEQNYSKAEIEESMLDIFPKGSKYFNIPEKIKSQLERMNWVGKKLEFSIESHKVSVYFIHPLNGPKEKILKWMKHIEKRIYIWLYIISHQSTRGCSKDLSVYFYFTEFKKEFPSHGEVIDRMCVNSAFTFTCKLNPSGENEIYVFRKEEWFKVFIHESFHSFALDFSFLDERSLSQIDTNILKIFPVRIDVRFYETYCEMWAEILNIIYFVYENEREKGKERDRTNIMVTKITQHLIMEQFFSLFQVCKILKSMRISYRELYEQTDKAKHKRIMNYREETQVMSYYILKSIFMFHFGEFIEWTTTHNKGSLNFLKTRLNLESYIGFVEEKYTNPDFLEEIDYIDGILDSLQNRQNQEKFSAEKRENTKSIYILRNLRMSIFEMA